MYEIEKPEVSDAFVECWSAAVNHLTRMVQGGQLSWLKANLNPPILEHLSFRIGNQLFYVRVEDIERNIAGPGNENGVNIVALGCNGHACRMPMRLDGGKWRSDAPDWGLVEVRTGKAVNPVALVTDEKIEMTDWEVQDLAVQVVRDHVAQKLGHQRMSSQGNPKIDPAIWFDGSRGLEWVVVRAVRYPELEAMIPSNILTIAANCARTSSIGHFASVSIANSDDAFDSSQSIPAEPLWRGHGMRIRFHGLESILLQ